MDQTTFYDPNTGQIVGSGTSNIIKAGSNSIIPGYFDSAKFYVSNGEAVERPTMPIVVSATSIKADGKADSVISGIPTGVTCDHEDTSTVMADTSIDFTAEHPGTYTFAFSKFPYIPVTITIEATS